MLTAERGLFQYTHWANQEILVGLKQGTPPNQKALRLFAHILKAEEGWLRRMQGEDTFGMNFWPDVSVAECEHLADRMRQAYTTFLGSLTAEDLGRKAVYRNSQGTEYQTAVRDVLVHVAFHGAYHRGQIAMVLRGDGVPPPYTDFIGFERIVGSPFE
ncbi:MAG: DinB family protein [Acidobacteria bacterium]|nr:DinB family protein [Acidobacteriota bacterium]